MWDKIHYALRKETFKVRDVAGLEFLVYGAMIGGLVIFLLLSMVIAGIVFAIIGIVKASKRKKARKMAENEQAVIAEEVPTNE